MMEKIKVFLVEDEVVIRNGIKNRIDWEGEGFEFVGEAGDGELAYPMIKETTPDIVITDIKMPFVNGLELSELIRKELPKIKIILLTGYDEFEYAREAIRLGISEYLLKPISSEKLVETLKTVAESIYKDKEDVLLRQKYEEDMRENLEREKLNFLNRLLAFDLSVPEVVENGKKFGMDFTMGCFFVMVFNAYGDMDTKGSIKNINAINEELEGKYAASGNIYLFQREIGGWVFIISAHDDNKLIEIKDEFTKGIVEIMDKYPSIRYFGGVGGPVHRVHHLPRAFTDAEEAFAKRFESEVSKIATKEELINDNGQPDIKEFVFSDFGKTGEMISRFIKSGTLEEVESFLVALKQCVNGEHFESSMVRNYVLMDVYIRCMTQCESINSSQESKEDYEHISDYKSRLTNIKSSEEVFEFIKDIVIDTITYREKTNELKFSMLVAKTKDMIEHQYMEKEFSLRTVADKLEINKSYLSRLFLSECGCSFTDYLVEYRLKKGEELLDNSDMTVTAISLEVGYSDPHYFSYVYKKVRGMTPREYRVGKRDN